MFADRPAKGVPPEEAVTEAAARWLARKDRGLAPGEAAELQHWQAADPRHAAELLRLETAWRDFELAKVSHELVVLAGELDRATEARSRSRSSPWRIMPAVAAAGVMLAAGLAWWPVATTETVAARASGQSYHVLTSAARQVVFDDGSVAELRGDTVVRAEFNLAERRVHLVRGEAHFTVKEDTTRPFVVNAGGAAVRAVGTAFNVRLDPERVEVLVTEGKVRVADAAHADLDALPALPLVIAGQRAVIERDGAPGGRPQVEVSAAAPTEVEQVLAWQSTRLVFDRTPLPDAVTAFNQYSASRGVQLVIGDAALFHRRLGGTFRADNMEGFVRLLEQSEEVRVERQAERIVLRAVR